MSSPEQLEALRRTLHSPIIQFAQAANYTATVIGGLVLLPLVLVTFALSEKAPRNGALVNFLAALVIWAFGGFLLPLTGQVQEPLPPRSLCFFQLGIMEGALVMAGIAAIVMVIHLILTLPTKQAPARAGSPALRVAMAATPGCAFMLYIFVQAQAAFSYGDKLPIKRNVFICRFATGSPFFFKKGPLVLTLTALAIVMAASVYLFIRIRRTMELAGFRDWRQLMKDESERGIWIALLVRVILFELICILCGVLVAVDTIHPPDPDGAAHIVILFISTGLVPLFTFLVFGTVTGVRRAWYECFLRLRAGRRRQPKSLEAESVV